MAGFTGGTGVAFPVPGSQIGVAIETVKGTPEAAPTYMVPVHNPDYTMNQQMIPDETLQGVMVQVQDLIRGMRSDDEGWDGPPYLDSFPLFIAACLGSPDTKGTAAASTTLAASATAGSSTLSITGVVAANDWIVVGSGGTLETHLITAVTGAGPYSATLDTPLLYDQANGAVVTGLTSHAWSVLNNVPSLGNQPPSLTVWDNSMEEWRQIAAWQLEDLTIKGNDSGLVNYSVKGMGNPAVQNVSAPSTAYTGKQTPAPWTLTCLLNGTQIVTVSDWEFNFNRQTKPVPALTGTQEYFEYLATALQASAKLTLVEQSGSPYLADFEAGTQLTLDFTLFDLVAGAALNIHSSKAMFKTGKLDRSKEMVEVPLDVQLLPTATDATAGGTSPVKITVANSVATAYN